MPCKKHTMKITFNGWLYKLLKENFRKKTTKELEEELKALKENDQELNHRREIIKEINELKKKNMGSGIKFDWKAFDDNMKKVSAFGDGMGQGLDMVLLGKEPKRKEAMVN